MAKYTTCDFCNEEVKWPDGVLTLVSGKSSGRYDFHRDCWFKVVTYIQYGYKKEQDG